MKKIALTADNYYSENMNAKYMSVSQFKDFIGTYGKEACEASALAKLQGIIEEETSTAMLVGSYVDAYYEGTLESFKEQHPEILKKDGSLKADYIKAEAMIERAERDNLFKRYMSGQKQVIMTGEIGGVPWKIKMDSYHPDTCIVDLKCVQSLTKLNYVRGISYLDFIRYWGYDIQGAVYQEIVRQNTGKKLPFYIAGISKEDAIDIDIIQVTDNYLNEALEIVKANIDRVTAIKNGIETPNRCCKCKYCRETKILKKPIGIDDLVVEI